MKQARYFMFATLLIAALGNVTPASAQMSDEHKAELEKLSRFVGEWVAEDAYYEGPDTRWEFGITMVGEPVIQDMAVEFTTVADIAEVGVFEEKDFLTYDAMEGKVTLMAVTNFGEVGVYTGDWDAENEDILHLSGEKTFKGDRYEFQLTVTFEDDDTIAWKVETTRNGEALSTFKATFVMD